MGDTGIGVRMPIPKNSPGELDDYASKMVKQKPGDEFRKPHDKPGSGRIQDDLPEMQHPEMPKSHSLSNIEARDWYNAQVAQIDTVEQEMRQAGKSAKEIFEVTTNFRNKAKQQARDLMKDRRAAARLEKESPIKSPEEYLAKYDGDYEKAIEASKRANPDVNRRIEQLRREKEGQTDV
jgi:hypothetical protein